MRRTPRILLAAFALASLLPAMPARAAQVKTVFLILMENHDLVDLVGNPDASFFNSTLLATGSSATQYYNPPGLHPSEPNYLWITAGTSFGIFDNNDPATNHIASHDHLAYQLEHAGISWRSYQENITGAVVPLVDDYPYAVRHNPFVYYDDLTGGGNANDPYGIAHNRPYDELAADLTASTVARFNFLKPNLIHDTHDGSIADGDAWLAAQIPVIQASAAYQDNGAIIIAYDESETADGPIPFVVLSPLQRGAGYSNTIPYTHSSLLRTLQEIYGVGPLLGDAANANDLSDLFAPGAVPEPASLVLVVVGVATLMRRSRNPSPWQSRERAG